AKPQISLYFAGVISASALALAIIVQRFDRNFELAGEELDRGFRRALQIFGDEPEKTQGAKLQRDAQLAARAVMPLHKTRSSFVSAKKEIRSVSDIFWEKRRSRSRSATVSQLTGMWGTLLKF